jgi:hypothetical protein
MKRSEVQIPDAAVWSALVAIGGIISWFVRLERRLNERLTFKQHKEICDPSKADLNKKLDELKDLIERQSEQSALHRSLIGDSLASIRTQVAVIRDRMGDDPLGDVTGRFRRGGSG